MSEPQLQLFFFIQTFILASGDARTRAPAAVIDADVAEAAGALAARSKRPVAACRMSTRRTSLTAEALRRELKTFLQEVGRGGGSRFEREAAEVLRGIERGAQHETPGSGAGPLDYLSLVARVLQERPPTRVSHAVNHPARDVVATAAP